jgi:hypothetical protein
MHPLAVLLAAGSPSCPDLSSFTPVVDRLAGLVAASIGALLVVNVLRAGLAYAHAHGRLEETMRAKKILEHTGTGLAIAALAVPIVGLLIWLVGSKICGA